MPITFRLSASSQWYLIYNHVYDFLWHSIHDRSLYVPGHDCVTADIVLSQLFGCRLGKGYHSTLGRGIVALAQVS